MYFCVYDNNLIKVKTFLSLQRNIRGAPELSFYIFFTLFVKTNLKRFLLGTCIDSVVSLNIHKLGFAHSTTRHTTFPSPFIGFASYTEMFSTSVYDIVRCAICLVWIKTNNFRHFLPELFTTETKNSLFHRLAGTKDTGHIDSIL